MAKKQAKKKGRAAKPEAAPKDFLDMIAPAAVKFNTDYYILGGSYHCTMALRGYPTSTEELALLRRLGEKSGVALRIYLRQVTPAEENAILHNAQNKNRMDRGSTNDMKQSITAEAPLFVQPLQHQLNGVDVPVAEILIGPKEVLQEGDVLTEAGPLAKSGGSFRIIAALRVP